VNDKTYREILLVVDHFLDVVSHQLLGLLHDVLGLGQLVALLRQYPLPARLVATHYLQESVLALAHRALTLNVAIQV